MKVSRLAVALSFVVAGCAAVPTAPTGSSPASAGAGSSAASSAVPSPTTQSPASPPASLSTTISGSTPVPGPGQPIILTGIPSQGVEVNCLLLDGYLLLGGPRELLASAQTLAIAGRTDESLMTTCQQGTPLLVESAGPAEPKTT